MSGVQVAKFDYRKVAACADDLSLPLRWFGMSEADIEKAAGRYVRGKSAGKVRGHIVYVKCTVGGWFYRIQGVIKPGMIFARFCATWGERCDWLTKEIDKFLVGATRVDTCYGHAPAAVRDQRAADAQWWELGYKCKQAYERSCSERVVLMKVFPKDEWPRFEFDDNAHVFATFEHCKAHCPSLG